MEHLRSVKAKKPELRVFSFFAYFFSFLQKKEREIIPLWKEKVKYVRVIG